MNGPGYPPRLPAARRPRGRNGELVVQESGLLLSPNYERWREAGRRADVRETGSRS